MTVDEMMEVAWRDFVDYCSRQEDVVLCFNKETGRNFLASRSPLEAAIDRATGRDEDNARAFTFWVTKNLWGKEGVPQKLKEEMEKLRGSG